MKLIFAVIFLFAAGSAVADNAPTTGQGRVLDLPFSSVAPFLWSGAPAKDLDYILERGSPLHMSWQIFRWLYGFQQTGDENLKGLAAAGLSKFINEWPSVYKQNDHVRWNYVDAYGKIQPGWWSGMDGFLAPMTFVAAYEAFGNESYLKLAKKALHTALQSPLEGGSVWREDEGCWISEFSWKGMKHEDEYYVLNGNLYGLQALKILADVLGDADAEETYQCVVQGTKAKSDQFYSSDGWTYYMLNSDGRPSVNPPHYAIYETAQYASLYSLTGDSFFDEQYLKHQSSLAQHLPIEISSDGTLLFSHVAPPHPYLLDTYPVSLECKLQDGSIYTVKENAPMRKAPYLDRAFIKAKPPSKPHICSATSHVGDATVELFSMPPLEVSSAVPEEQPFSLSAAYDGTVIKGGDVRIDPAKTYENNEKDYRSNRANLSFSGNFEVGPTDMFGIELTSARRVATGVTITDDAGATATRYYPGIAANTPTLLLLSLNGFPGYEALKGKLTNITIHIWTDEGNLPDQSEFDLKAGALRVFSNRSSIYRILSTEALVIPQGEY